MVSLSNQRDLRKTYPRSSNLSYHRPTAAWQTPDVRQRSEGGRCGAAGAMALAVRTAWCVGGLEARAVIIVPNTAGAKNLRAGPWCPHETGLRMPGSRGLYIADANPDGKWRPLFLDLLLLFENPRASVPRGRIVVGIRGQISDVSCQLSVVSCQKMASRILTSDI